MKQSMVALLLTTVAASQVECFFNKDGQVLCKEAIVLKGGGGGGGGSDNHNHTNAMILKGGGGGGGGSDNHNHTNAINMHHGEMGETHNNTASVILRGNGGGGGGDDGHNHKTASVNLRGNGGGGDDGHNHQTAALLSLAETEDDSTTVNASFKLDTYTITLISIFAFQIFFCFGICCWTKSQVNNAKKETVKQ